MVLTSVHFLQLIIVKFFSLVRLIYRRCFFNHIIKLIKLIELSRVNDTNLSFFLVFKKQPSIIIIIYVRKILIRSALQFSHN